MPRRVEGIKCAHCKERHVTVAQVKLCGKRANDAKAEERERTALEEHEAEVQAAAEWAAEQAAERWFEERGGPVEDDRIEREAWAREDELRYDVMIQQREIAQDRAVAEVKMDRGFTLGGTRRRRPW